MKNYTKNLTTQQLKRALRMFYGSQKKSLEYTYMTVNAAVQHNWTNVNNFCPSSDGGYFSFKYKGNKVFECSTTYPELLVA